jgi:hypothetical protein
MSLPDFAWQVVYGRLAWAVVLASVLVALFPGPWRRRRGLPVALLAASLVLMLLPGQASPAYWLVLAFQYPSALLAACCLLKLVDGPQGGHALGVLPPGLAGALAVGGAALYLDGFGLLSQGYYYAGFSATGVPLLTVAASLACAWAIARGRHRRQAIALLGALALFAVLRLPTGNLWDALIDPLLWAWAVFALARAGLRKLRRAPAAPVPPLEAATALPVLGVAGADTYSTSKEQVSGN